MKKNEIHIAMLIDCYNGDFLGGGQVHVQNLVKYLKKHNCEIDIYSQKNSQIAKRLWWNFQTIFPLIRKHQQKPYDLIHAHAYSAGIAAKILSKLLKIPVVYTVHGSNTLDLVSLKKQSKNWKYFLEKWLLTGIKYDQQISVAENFLQYSNVNKNIAIIENGIEITKNQNTKYKIKDSKIKTLLFVGRLEKIKGVDLLLQAMVKVDQKISPWQLKIVGDGLEKDSLKKMTRDLKIDSKIVFLGKKTNDDLEKEYLSADLFILPSLTEGQPLTLLEAWKYKLPVLITKVGHNTKMVKHKKDGFLVDPDNINKMAESIKLAFSQKNNWAKMGENGFAKVTKNYTWDITAEKTKEIYVKLIQNTKRSVSFQT